MHANDVRVGTVWGRWTVIGPYSRHGQNNDAYFPCRCACGTKKSVRLRVLREAQAGKVVGSCGCAHAESMAAKRRYGQPDTPEYHRARWLRNKYGLTPEQWDALVLKQEGRCALCERPCNDMHVDHDHKNNEVRGLLCHHCNVGLGHFGDDVVLLRKAAGYLVQTRRKMKKVVVTD